MNIVERYSEIDRTGQVRPRRTQVNLRVEKTGDTMPSPVPSFDHQSEYIMRLRVGRNFWANDAQFESARQQNMKALMHELYKDALGHIAEIRSSLMEDDFERALVACGELEKDLGL